jgi:diguanylate cyclase (GGDEF)-like protein
MAIYPEWVTTETGGGQSGAPAPATAEAETHRADDEARVDVAASAEVAPEAAAPMVAPDAADAEPIAIVAVPVPPPSGWNDPLTGTDGPHYWDRLMISEAARVRRYKRPTTVVFVEIAGLTRLGQLWGADVVERTLISAARTLSQSMRTSDHIARIEPIRFGIMLTETAEIAAINFIERARASCERDLRVASEVVGVAFGWASPPKTWDLADAVALAQKRLEAELKTL